MNEYAYILIVENKKRWKCSTSGSQGKSQWFYIGNALRNNAEVSLNCIWIHTLCSASYRFSMNQQRDKASQNVAVILKQIKETEWSEYRNWEYNFQMLVKKMSVLHGYLTKEVSWEAGTWPRRVCKVPLLCGEELTWESKRLLCHFKPLRYRSQMK